MDRENFFDSLRRGDTPQDDLRYEYRQLAYEERIIKRVFSECGIKITGWGLLANLCRHETAKDKLNFGWFNKAFRRFPGKLCGKRIPRLHELSFHHDLFKPHKKNRLAKAVSKALAGQEISESDDSWIFVFPVVRTFFCAHNIEYATPGVTLSLRDDSGKFMLAVTPSHALFQTIGKEWFEL